MEEFLVTRWRIKIIVFTRGWGGRGGGHKTKIKKCEKKEE